MARSEATLADNLTAFARWQWQPRTLAGVSAVDLATSVFGERLPLPVALAPTGYTRMIHPGGEIAVAAAAAARGVPYVVSNVATTAIGEVAAASARPVWAQLYLCRDRAVSWDYLGRAEDAGSSVLEVSVDTMVPGQRGRDLANGLTIPPTLGLRTLAGIAVRPGYWARALAAPAYGFANIEADGVTSVASMSDLFEPALDWSDLAEIRRRWSGRILVKGPIGAGAARELVAAGVDGLHLSNHGGRQLDRCVPPIETLAAVRAAIGPELPVIVDSGFRHGSDIALALALGADLVMVGRAYLYGLAAGGRAGVLRAIDLLTAELRRTLHLVGVASVAELPARAGEVLVERKT